MFKLFNRQLKKLFSFINNKNKAEVFFWEKELKDYISWYQGSELRGIAPPSKEQKISKYSLPINAMTTWLMLFQEQKYLSDLELSKDSLKGLKVLDVGCGPFPNLLAFDGCERFGVDPLINQYKSVGYPLDLWSNMGFKYCHSKAEKMPFSDQFFTGIISVNAIDHVDDFAKVAKEIKRVLAVDGFFRMHVHYHLKTITEPIELNDEIFLQHYNWVKGLQKIHESRKKDCGKFTCKDDELYVLWGN